MKHFKIGGNVSSIEIEVVEQRAHVTIYVTKFGKTGSLDKLCVAHIPDHRRVAESIELLVESLRRTLGHNRHVGFVRVNWKRGPS